MPSAVGMPSLEARTPGSSCCHLETRQHPASADGWDFPNFPVTQEVAANVFLGHNVGGGEGWGGEGMLGGRAHGEAQTPSSRIDFFLAICLYMPSGALCAFISSSCSLNFFCLALTALPLPSPPFRPERFLDFCSVQASLHLSISVSLPVSCSPPPTPAVLSCRLLIFPGREGATLLEADTVRQRATQAGNQGSGFLSNRTAGLASTGCPLAVTVSTGWGWGAASRERGAGQRPPLE